jgi:branched-chain amino acid transport system substrate-binding protein
MTRRDALVAAAAASALGGGALLRPLPARAAATTNIGVILPLSKPGDLVAGGNVLKTAQLWAATVNDAGGVKGQRVALKTYDDKGDPERGAKAVVRAIE